MKISSCVRILLLALLLSPLAQAQTLRWASQGDALTMDPQSQNEGLNNAINGQVYENRAKSPVSTFSVYAHALGTPVAIDAQTVEFRLDRVSPAFLEHLDSIAIMSGAWCEQQKVTRPLDFKSKEESFASFNANGTGPYQLLQRQPGIKTSFKRYPGWWGKGIVEPVHADRQRRHAAGGADLG